MIFHTLLSVISLAVAASASTSMVLYERRAAVPSGFVRHGSAPANHTVTLRVGLAANDVPGLHKKLNSIATPGSAEFRQWLSKDEVKAYTQPSTEMLSAFNTFSSASGLELTPISPNGDWYSITLQVSQANTLFAADFELFTHPSLDAPIARTLSVSLPSQLVRHVNVLHPSISFVTPNVRLVPAMSDLRKRDVAASCNSTDLAGIITPTCLQELYGIPTTPATENSSTLLICRSTFKLLTTDNGTNEQNVNDTGMEANPDTQYTTDFATGVPTQFLSVGEFDFPKALFDTTTFLDGIENPPMVMTTSYGDPEANFGASVATKICNGYLALGTRGISVMTASGDGGVRGNHDSLSVCQNNTFIPVFPATCTFVTAVGSTQGFAPEKAVNFTGGGFSNFFAAPDFQTSAVAGFLKTIPDNFTGTFNKTGRGYPDVSTQGWNFEIVALASASAPTFASIIVLINDRLIAANKPTLRYLNPFLYSMASSTFIDITAGHNLGIVCPASSVALDATVGWDPLTGFGTPVFADLLAAAFA
ncbi:subtilisin-like protein [Mycena polygramma]|nr:subtilisin-like protein [Mycena polygramma]